MHPNGQCLSRSGSDLRSASFWIRVTWNLTKMLHNAFCVTSRRQVCLKIFPKPFLFLLFFRYLHLKYNCISKIDSSTFFGLWGSAFVSSFTVQRGKSAFVSSFTGRRGKSAFVSCLLYSAGKAHLWALLLDSAGKAHLWALLLDSAGKAHLPLSACGRWAW